jgi:hypothetical protein
MSRSRNPKNPEQKTRDVNFAVRTQTALKLSAQGFSWDEIAAKSGFASRGAAHNAVMRELDRNIAKDVDEMRKRELHMLNTMQSECWELFMDKKNRGRLFAADRLLQISERRCKLLGLDVARDTNIAAAQVIIRQYDAEIEAV